VYKLEAVGLLVG